MPAGSPLHLRVKSKSRPTGHDAAPLWINVKPRKKGHGRADGGWCQHLSSVPLYGVPSWRRWCSDSDSRHSREDLECSSMAFCANCKAQQYRDYVREIAIARPFNQRITVIVALFILALVWEILTGLAIEAFFVPLFTFAAFHYLDRQAAIYNYRHSASQRTPQCWHHLYKDGLPNWSYYRQHRRAPLFRRVRQ